MTDCLLIVTYQEDLMAINSIRIVVISVLGNFFLKEYLAINHWNGLPRDIIESPNVIILKSKLDIY